MYLGLLCCASHFLAYRVPPPPPPHFPRRESHGIIEWFGFTGTFNSHLNQLTCNEKGHLYIQQGVQSFSQPDLECCQGWDTYDFSGQSMPAFHHLHCKKNIFLTSYLNLLSFSLKTLPLVLLLEPQLKSLSPFFLQVPFTY